MLSPDPDDRPSASELYEILIEKCPIYLKPVSLKMAEIEHPNKLPSLYTRNSYLSANILPKGCAKMHKKFDVRINKPKGSMNQIQPFKAGNKWLYLIH